jgi:hypothetical protein
MSASKRKTLGVPEMVRTEFLLTVGRRTGGLCGGGTVRGAEGMAGMTSLRQAIEL